MDWLFNPIFYGLAELIAKILNLVVDVCGAICGIPDENGNSLIINLISPGQNGNVIYWVFGGLSIVTVLFSVFFAVAESFRVKAADGVSMQRPYFNIFKAIFHIFLVSSLFFIAVMVVGEIGSLFGNAFGGNKSIGGTILSGCFDTASIQGYEDNMIKWNKLWENGAIPSWGDINIGGLKDGFNVWQALISTGAVAVPMAGIAIYLGKRLVNIILLFAVAPISFSMYPVDDGHAKNEWYKDMKGALLGGIAIMIMLYIYLMFMNVIYKTVLLPDDSVMNGIFQAIIVGAGVSALIPITKTVLKYLGCDDVLLSTAATSISPVRALRAVKNGVKGIVGRVGGKSESKFLSGDKGAETASDREEAVQKKAVAIARTRFVANKRANAMGSIGVDRLKQVSDGVSGANANGGRTRIPARSGITARNVRSPVLTREINKNRKRNATERKKEVQRIKSVKDSEKRNKEQIGALTTAMNRLQRTLKSLKKSKTKSKNENVKLVAERNVIKSRYTKKIERTREVKPFVVRQKQAQPNNNIRIESKQTNTVHNQNRIASRKKQNDGTKESIDKMRYQISVNTAKLKRINGNVQSLPRKISKIVKKK